MSVLEEVAEFINTSVFHTDIWDTLDETKKQKAIRNASSQLYTRYKQYDEAERPIPVEPIAYQALWIVEKDDSMRRAEHGASSMSVGGMTVSMREKDAYFSPEVIRILGRRVGQYSLGVRDTFRHRTNPKYSKRGF